MNIRPEQYNDVFGFAVAALLAVATYVGGAKSQRLALAALVALTGITAVSVIIIRVEVIPRIEVRQQQNDELANRINKSAELKMSLEAYTSGMEAADKAPPVVRQVFEAKVAAWHDYLSSVTTGRLVVPPNEVIPLGSELVRAASKTIVGTSYVNSSEWWGTDEGEQYLKLNKQFIDRGGTIDRVFIFSSVDEFNANAAIMRRQKDLGIRVSYLLVQDFKGFTDDMIVVDQSISGVLRLNPDKGMTGAEFYWDEKNCKRITANITAIAREAKTFE